MSVPNRFSNKLIRATLISGGVFKIDVTSSTIALNGDKNIVKKKTVKKLKKIEKWISFLLSLLELKMVNNPSKLVPMLAPKTKGIA